MSSLQSQDQYTGFGLRTALVGAHQPGDVHKQVPKRPQRQCWRERVGFEGQEWDKALGEVQGLSPMHAVVVEVCPTSPRAKHFQPKGACSRGVLAHKVHKRCETEGLGLFPGGLAGDLTAALLALPVVGLGCFCGV